MSKSTQNNQPHDHKTQAAFLIRCWREGEQWRFSVEDIASRQHRRYDSAAALLAALQGQLPDKNENASQK